MLTGTHAGSLKVGSWETRPGGAQEDQGLARGPGARSSWETHRFKWASFRNPWGFRRQWNHPAVDWIVQTPYPQCDCIWRWAFKEVTKV